MASSIKFSSFKLNTKSTSSQPSSKISQSINSSDSASSTQKSNSLSSAFFKIPSDSQDGTKEEQPRSSTLLSISNDGLEEITENLPSKLIIPCLNPLPNINYKNGNNSNNPKYITIQNINQNSQISTNNVSDTSLKKLSDETEELNNIIKSEPNDIEHSTVIEKESQHSNIIIKQEPFSKDDTYDNILNQEDVKNESLISSISIKQENFNDTSSVTTSSAINFNSTTINQSSQISASSTISKASSTSNNALSSSTLTGLSEEDKEAISILQRKAKAFIEGDDTLAYNENNVVLPLLYHNTQLSEIRRSGISDKDMLKKEVEILPEMDSEGYENVPISEFGIAMLLGMGYDPKKHTNKPLELHQRIYQRAGLGADKFLELDMQKAKENIDTQKAKENIDMQKAKENIDMQKAKENIDMQKKSKQKSNDKDEDSIESFKNANSTSESDHRNQNASHIQDSGVNTLTEIHRNGISNQSSSLKKLSNSSHKNDMEHEYLKGHISNSKEHKHYKQDDYSHSNREKKHRKTSYNDRAEHKSTDQFSSHKYKNTDLLSNGHKSGSSSDIEFFQDSPNKQKKANYYDEYDNKSNTKQLVHEAHIDDYSTYSKNKNKNMLSIESSYENKTKEGTIKYSDKTPNWWVEEGLYVKMINPSSQFYKHKGIITEVKMNENKQICCYIDMSLCPQSYSIDSKETEVNNKQKYANASSNHNTSSTLYSQNNLSPYYPKPPQKKKTYKYQQNDVSIDSLCIWEYMQNLETTLSEQSIYAKCVDPTSKYFKQIVYIQDLNKQTNTVQFNTLNKQGLPNHHSHRLTFDSICEFSSA